MAERKKSKRNLSIRKDESEEEDSDVGARQTGGEEAAATPASPSVGTRLMGRLKNLRSPKAKRGGGKDGQGARIKNKKSSNKKAKEATEKEQEPSEDKQADDVTKTIAKKQASFDVESQSFVGSKVNHVPAPESQFSNRQRLVHFLCALQLATWILGTEVVCLYGGHCTITMQQDTNPNVVDGGGILLLLSSIAIGLVVLPCGVYLMATEVQANARIFALLSLLTSAYLFVTSMVYFGMKVNPESISWSSDSIARFYYNNQSEDAVDDAKNASMSFAVLFLLAALSMTLLSLLACFMSFSFPKTIVPRTRYTLLPLSDTIDAAKRKQSSSASTAVSTDGEGSRNRRRPRKSSAASSSQKGRRKSNSSSGSTIDRPSSDESESDHDL